MRRETKDGNYLLFPGAMKEMGSASTDLEKSIRLCYRVKTIWWADVLINKSADRESAASQAYTHINCTQNE